MQSFPPAWLWLVDETVPQWVKKHYSPRESWKNKPFEKEDARFFFKGIGELSELFTEERPRKLPEYFSHPKFRSAYLLYFLPLQAAKFLTIYHLHLDAIRAALKHAQTNGGVLRIVDLGAGPGTASLALLLHLMDSTIAKAGELPRIELQWFDTNRAIMEDGRAIAMEFAEQFPRLRGKIEVHLHAEPWWKAAAILRSNPAWKKSGASLTLAGHLFNEVPAGPGKNSDKEGVNWQSLVQIAGGGGLLVVEPAGRAPSQKLSQIRDRIFEHELLKPEASSLWGPCLHSGRCPLAQGRDWCHFSVPVWIPGEWFKFFSKALSSEKEWVKFSYLWLASPEYPAPNPTKDMRRVVSDPIRAPGRRQGPAHLLLCEPEIPNRIEMSGASLPHRGDLYRLPKPSLKIR